MMSTFAALVLAWTVQGPPAEPVPPAEVSYEAFRAELDPGIVTALMGLADWCTENSVFAARAEVYERVLALDPDHMAAHQGLKHRRRPDGSWILEPPRHPPKDFDKKARAAYEERLLEVLAPFGRQVADWARNHGPELPPEELEAICDDVLEFDPNNAWVHGLRGEVRAEDGSWVLAETELARAGRARIKEAVREGYRDAPLATPIEPDEDERALGVSWKHSLGTPLMRIHGTGKEEELMRVAGGLHATRHVFAELVGVEASYGPELTLYLLAKRGERDRFLAHHPGLDEQSRAAFLAFEGGGIQGTDDFVHWSKDPEHRIDAAIHYGLSWLVADAFGLGAQFSWLAEGFCLYLTRELTGTRLNWFFDPDAVEGSPQEEALLAKLFAPDANWMATCHDMVTALRPLSFAPLLDKTGPGLGVEEMLLSYVLAAWLLEAHPEALAPAFTALGEGHSVRRALTESIDVDLEQIDAHVARWIEERH